MLALRRNRHPFSFRRMFLFQPQRPHNHELELAALPKHFKDSHYSYAAASLPNVQRPNTRTAVDNEYPWGQSKYFEVWFGNIWSGKQRVQQYSQVVRGEGEGEVSFTGRFGYLVSPFAGSTRGHTPRYRCARPNDYMKI